MRSSLRKRSLASILFTIIAAFFVGYVFSSLFATRYYAGVKQRTMINLYNKVEELYGRESSFDELTENYRKLALLCEENTISLFIMNSSAESEFTFGNEYFLVRRLWDIIFTSNKGASIISQTDNYTLQTVQSDTSGQRYMEIWGYLSNGSFFIARSSYSGMTNSVTTSMFFFLFVILFLFLIVGAMIFLVTKPYADSIDRMNRFAKAANEGDFAAESEYAERKKRRDELGLLGENIYEMSHKLEKTISELKTTNLRLQNELREKQELEEARKKYMSDVSHELKTPIAIISGYAEGLKEGVSTDPEDIAYYCDVIIDESEKMNLMIKKLATLNQLEQGRSEVSLERFNVTEAIDGFLNTMNMVIEENGARVFFDNSVPVYVWSDEFLFEEVLMNYFNNAIHHLNEEKVIRINVEHRDNGNVRVTVFNSGENIDEAEIDKIWTKFYKVDKARTREHGGQGLGLSIVKAVADSLNKDCGVDNYEDGVAFWIELEAAVPRNDGTDESQPEKKAPRKIRDVPAWRTRKREKSEDAGNKQ